LGRLVREGIEINELQLTLTSTLGKRGITMSALAERARYGSRFFEDVVTGKSRKVPVDFFVRADRILELTEEGKNA
jgi:hypothetical protein